jgi:hypothetical protein
VGPVLVVMAVASPPSVTGVRISNAVGWEPMLSCAATIAEQASRKNQSAPACWEHIHCDVIDMGASEGLPMPAIPDVQS